MAPDEPGTTSITVRTYTGTVGNAEFYVVFYDAIAFEPAFPTERAKDDPPHGWDYHRRFHRVRAPQVVGSPRGGHLQQRRAMMQAMRWH